MRCAIAACTTLTFREGKDGPLTAQAEGVDEEVMSALWRGDAGSQVVVDSVIPPLASRQAPQSVGSEHTSQLPLSSMSPQLPVPEKA